MSTTGHISGEFEACLDVQAAEWNRFLEAVPGSHHLQSTLWAELKGPLSWEADRVALRRKGAIVAAIQVLHRLVGGCVRVGYAPRGPVFAEENEQLSGLLISELLKLARRKKLGYLTVQPPQIGAGFVPVLLANGFAVAPFEVAPTATVLIDVQHSAADLLAGMRRSTRRAIHKHDSSQLRVRAGSESDLVTFHALLSATGQRHGFRPPNLEYFQNMWRLFAASDDIVLFLAEAHGEAVAAELDVTFGDTLVTKRAGWSGKFPELHPAVMVIWTALNWARDRGLRYYDMEGFDPVLARLVIEGAEIPDEGRQSHHWFKYGFGGKMVMLPENYETVRLSVLGQMYRTTWGRRLSALLRRWLGGARFQKASSTAIRSTR